MNDRQLLCLQQSFPRHCRELNPMLPSNVSRKVAKIVILNEQFPIEIFQTFFALATYSSGWILASNIIPLVTRV